MKAILALCFIALFAGAFAHKSKAHFQESKLISSLKGLFQLASEDELEDVADILAEVRHEIESTLDRVRNNYAAEESDWDNTASQYEDVLSQVSTGLDDLHVAIEEGEEVEEQLEEAIDSSVNAIADAQAQQDAEEARRADYHNAFSAKVGQLNDAVSGAEDALRLLQEIDTQDLSGSFLEINNKKIHTACVQIHKTLKGMKVTSTVATMTSMLVEIASAGINHDLIAQIEDLLNQLIEILNAEVDAAVNDDNNDDEFSRSTLETLQNTIDAQSEAAESNQAYLDEVQEDLEEAREAVDYLNNVWDQLTSSYEEATDAWKEKSHTYDALIHRLEKDIEALEAAEDFVDNE